MADRKTTVFFYLEEEADELKVHSDDLDSGNLEYRRMSYDDYVEKRNEEFCDHEPVDVYRLAEKYLEEHPVNALRSGMLDQNLSCRVVGELWDRKEKGEDIDRDTLSERLQQENVSQVLDLEEFSQRLTVETGMTVR